MRWKLAKKEKKDIIDQLLIIRDIDLKEKKPFLSPRLTDLFDPFLLPDMKEAVKEILIAQKKEEKIGIFADYDADGIPGAVLMKEILDYLRIDSEIYIPQRKEGYGLSKKGINYFIKRNCQLIITIDCGITNIKEIAYAREKGFKTIVLDHHEPPRDLPRAEAVVDAKRRDSQYPDREISGATVVFKLGQALAKKRKIKKKLLRWSLDLIAISVITDMVPLVKENRILACFGLHVLKQTKRLGLKALYQTARIDPQTINPYTVGFQIGPRINAPGRVDHANRSFYLLATKDQEEANSLANSINQINQERRDQLEKIYQKAKEKVEKKRLEKKHLIIVGGKDWPKGIIGLVAGRLTEEYTRPVIVFTKGPKYLEASARSISAFHILQALEESSQFLLRFGGHRQAAGLKMKNEHLNSLYDNLLEIAENKLTKKDLIPILSIDLELTFKEITPRLYKRLKRLEPHGLGNPRPLFLAEKAEVVEKRLVGNDQQHLKLKLRQENKVFDTIGFDLGNLGKKIEPKDKIDIAYSIEENLWNGRRSLELYIKDLRESK